MGTHLLLTCLIEWLQIDNIKIPKTQARAAVNIAVLPGRQQHMHSALRIHSALNCVFDADLHQLLVRSSLIKSINANQDAV
jgi:hypothetical protein